MKAKLCSATREDGTSCRAVAPTGKRVCRYHKELDQRICRRYRALRPPAIRLGPLTNRPAILRAINRIFRAQLNGSLPPDRDTLLLNCISVAINNLHR